MSTPVAPPREAAPTESKPDEPFAELAQVPPAGRGSVRLLQAIPSAVTALRANVGRTVLTALGIIIGVGAVIVIVALGEGASASVSAQLQGLGTNVLTITPSTTQSGGARSAAGSVTTLTAEDAGALGTQPGVSALSAVASGSAQVIAGDQNWSTRVNGVMPSYLTIEDWTVAQGAAFTTEDNTNSSNVALLGATVASELFPTGENPVGQSIQIRNVPFTVIGVLASKGSSVGGNQDDQVLIPLQTAQVRLFGSTSVGQVVLQVDNTNDMNTVQSEITTLLRQRHDIQPSQASDFTIQNNTSVISRATSVDNTLTLLLGGVAAVSLVVGGIGIMNIMLVSVTERTREIGIRLGIGARPRDVLSQFLVEAVVLSVLGGVIGIAIGVAATLLVPVLTGYATVIPWSAIGLAFGFSAAIGLSFGIYPARRASQLDPIVALRYE